MKIRCGRTLRDIIVLGFLMTIFGSCVGQLQEVRIKETPFPINATLGQNVTLPCFLIDQYNNELDLDLSALSVRWRRILKNGSEIDVFKWAESSGHEKIRPGADIDRRELKRGNVSLTLPYVQTNDEGRYSCTIFLTPKKYPTTINVHVFAQPNVTLSTTKLTVEPRMQKSVTCEVSKFYPEAVEVRWEKFDKGSGNWSNLDTYLSKPKKNRDGSFNVTSQLIVAPSSTEENGDVYVCVVSHSSISKDKYANFTLTVTESFSHLFHMITPSSVVVSALIVVCILYFLKLNPFRNCSHSRMQSTKVTRRCSPQDGGMEAFIQSPLMILEECDIKLRNKENQKPPTS